MESSPCVLSHLLLQKPSPGKSTESHSKHLQRRLVLWKAGDLRSLIEEAACIQDHLPRKSGKRGEGTDDSASDTRFAKMVFEGKIHAALRYISEDNTGGVLRMEDRPLPDCPRTVREILEDKHPAPRTPPPSVLLEGPPKAVNPIMFESLTPELMKDVGRHAKGSAGPSGLDADAWKRMMTCFKAASNRLCSSMAEAAICLCTADLDNVDLSGIHCCEAHPVG